GPARQRAAFCRARRVAEPAARPAVLPGNVGAKLFSEPGMGDLDAKTALVTGAASGIGLATVELFARRGAKVALNHLPDDPRGPAAVERLRAAGFAVIAAPGDVSKPGTAEKMVAAAIDAL